jgi:hypothetical protein
VALKGDCVNSSTPIFIQNKDVSGPLDLAGYS